MADEPLGLSPLALAAFELFFLPWQRSRLDVRVLPPPVPLPSGRPLIFAANHVSWWDGFLVRALHRRLRPRAPLFTVMSAAELRRRPVLRAFGACPLDGTTAGTLRLVRALERRRSREPSLCVSLFPQGAIWPSTRRPLGFARGVELFARRLAPCSVVPVALHIEPLNRVRPAAFVRAGAPIAGAEATVERVEAAVARELSALHEHLATSGGYAGAGAWSSGHDLQPGHGRAAESAESRPAASLPTSRTGVTS